MVLRLDEVMFVLCVVIPGLIYIHYGRRTLRYDWVAIRTKELVVPYFIFLLLLAFGATIFESGVGSADDPPYSSPLFSIFSSIFGIPFVFLFPLAACYYYIVSMGQILIFGGRRDIVMKAVQEILVKNQLSYKLDGDSFDIPSIKMKIEVHWSESKDLVGIRRWTWDFGWLSRFDRSIIATFKGLPSERTHPALMGMGVSLVVIGLVLGGAMALY